MAGIRAVLDKQYTIEQWGRAGGILLGICCIWHILVVTGVISDYVWIIDFYKSDFHRQLAKLASTDVVRYFLGGIGLALFLGWRLGTREWAYQEAAPQLPEKERTSDDKNKSLHAIIAWGLGAMLFAWVWQQGVNNGVIPEWGWFDKEFYLANLDTWWGQLAAIGTNTYSIRVITLYFGFVFATAAVGVRIINALFPNAGKEAPVLKKPANKREVSAWARNKYYENYKIMRMFSIGGFWLLIAAIAGVYAALEIIRPIPAANNVFRGSLVAAFLGVCGLIVGLGHKLVYFSYIWRLFCPHCDKAMPSDMEWTCQHCKKFHKEGTYSYLHRCGNPKCKRVAEYVECPHCRKNIALLPGYIAPKSALEQADERLAEAATVSEPAPESETEPQEANASEGLAQEGLYIGDTCPTEPKLFWRYPLPKVYVRDFPEEDRFKHTYILGLTGAGKTTVLKHLIPQDIEDRSVDKGVIVMGPDRALFEYLAACVPRWRSQDILYFNPARVYGKKVIGWNPLDFSEGKNLPEELWQPLYQQKVGSVFKVLSRTLENVTEPQREILLEAIYGLVALDQVALKDFDTLLDPRNPTLRHAIANARRVDERTRRFWRDYDNDAAHQASATAMRKKFVSLFHEPLVTLFARHAFTWHDILAEPRIIFIDLSQIGSPAKETVAELVLAEIEVEVLRREQSKREKIPYYLYIDEFADFIRAGESTNELFAKARKNWLGFTLAHQVTGQIPANVRAVVEGNAQTCIVLKLSHQDAPSFAKKMQLHLFDEAAYNAIMNKHAGTFYNYIEHRREELERQLDRWSKKSSKAAEAGQWGFVQQLDGYHDEAMAKLEALNKRPPNPPNNPQWHKEAMRAAYDSDVSSEMLMNLQPGLAVVQMPGPFPRGIPVQIPLPPERSGQDHLLDDSIQRLGVPRTSPPTTSAIEDDAPVTHQDEPSATEDFDEQSHEQFLQQKPARRTRRDHGPRL